MVDFGWVVWLLFLLLLLQPMVAQRMLEASRRRQILAIQRERGSRVIVLVHRQETISFFGIPFYRFLTMEDSEEVLRALERTPQHIPVDLVLHTPGGLVIAAVQIARALRRRQAPTRAIIPHYAMSGGTLIALAADEIIMSPHAVLGPLDPQVAGYPAPSIVALRHMKDPNNISDQWLTLVDVAAKAMSQMEAVVMEILEGKLPPEKARKLARLLTSGTWTHDYPLTADELKRWGLKVSTDIPQEFMELMELYRQPFRQRQQAVEYVPFHSYEREHIAGAGGRGRFA